MRTLINIFAAAWFGALLALVLLGPFVALAIIVSYIVGLG